MMNGVIRHLLAAVADRTVTLRYRMWSFGEGPAILGLLAAGELLGRADLIEHVNSLVAKQEIGTPDDHLINVEVLTRLGVPLDAPAIQSWARSVRSPVHRPDLIGLDRLMWVDCMHTDGPGLALTNLAAAAPTMHRYVTALQDDSGLFSHGYDVIADRANGVHWGRGQGWALTGLVGTLAHLSDPALAASLDALLHALGEYEVDGRWRTIVDDESPVELSTSALVAAGILTGITAGVVGEKWADLAERALAAAVEETTAGVLAVSEATPVGTPVTYRTRRTGCFAWGQGPLLLALAAREGL